MFDENKRHHKVGTVVVHRLDATRNGMMRVISYLLDGRVRLAYVDARRQKRFGVPEESTLVFCLNSLYPAQTFDLIGDEDG